MFSMTYVKKKKNNSLVCLYTCI